MDGACPECGTPIAHSLAGNLLRYCPDSYLGTLERGASIIFWASVASVGLTILTVALSILSMSLRVQSVGPNAMAGAIGGVEIFSIWAGAALSTLGVFGWFLLSTEQPALEGTDGGSRARRVVRVCIIAYASCSLLAAVLISIPALTSGLSVGDALAIGVAAIPNFLGGLASAVAFFAEMQYLAWLSPRIPDKDLERRAKQFMWLGPVLFIVGSCVVVGPLIAWILFLRIIWTVRRDLQGVRADRERSGITAMVGT